MIVRCNTLKVARQETDSFYKMLQNTIKLKKNVFWKLQKTKADSWSY